MARRRTRRARGGCRSWRSRPTTIGAVTAMVSPSRARGSPDERPGRLEAVLGAKCICLGGAQDDALLRRLVHPRRRAHDVDDEEVEQHEKRDLADQERLVGFEGDSVTTEGAANTTSVAPIVMRSPSRRRARSTCLPLTSTPFVDPRSTIRSSPLLAQLRVPAGDVHVRDADVRLARAPEHDARGRDLVRAAGDGQRDHLALCFRRRRVGTTGAAAL